MKHIETNARKLSFTHMWALLGVLVSIAAPARAGTIDFETPSLAGANEISMPIYEAQGVTITTSHSGLLVRESAYYACEGIAETNQSLHASSSYWICGIFNYCCWASMRIDFSQVSEPVFRVSAEVRGWAPILRLELYDANDNLIGGGEQLPMPVACEPPIRGVVQATAPQPVAHAVIWNPYHPSPPCDSCCYPQDGGDIFLIDNLAFDRGTVAAQSATWGALKVRYR